MIVPLYSVEEALIFVRKLRHPNKRTHISKAANQWISSASLDETLISSSVSFFSSLPETKTHHSHAKAGCCLTRFHLPFQKPYRSPWTSELGANSWGINAVLPVLFCWYLPLDTQREPPLSPDQSKKNIACCRTMFRPSPPQLLGEFSSADRVVQDVRDPQGHILYKVRHCISEPFDPAKSTTTVCSYRRPRRFWPMGQTRSVLPTELGPRPIPHSSGYVWRRRTTTTLS